MRKNKHVMTLSQFILFFLSLYTFHYRYLLLFSEVPIDATLGICILLASLKNWRVKPIVGSTPTVYIHFFLKFEGTSKNFKPLIT